MRPVIYISSLVRSFRHSPGLAAQYLAQDLLRGLLWLTLFPLWLPTLTCMATTSLIIALYERGWLPLWNWLVWNVVQPVTAPPFRALDAWRDSLKSRLIARREAWEANDGGEHD